MVSRSTRSIRVPPRNEADRSGSTQRRMQEDINVNRARQGEPKRSPAMSTATKMFSQKPLATKTVKTPTMTYKKTLQTVDGKGKPVFDRTDKNANRLGDRRAVGQADAATRRRALDSALQSGPPVKNSVVKRTNTIAAPKSDDRNYLQRREDDALGDNRRR